MVKPPRKRAQKRGTIGMGREERRLMMWRGYVLVTVVGAGLSAIAAAYYAERGDPLTGGLFLATLFVLLAVAVVALVQVRRQRARVDALGRRGSGGGSAP